MDNNLVLVLAMSRVYNNNYYTLLYYYTLLAMLILIQMSVSTHQFQNM